MLRHTARALFAMVLLVGILSSGCGGDDPPGENANNNSNNNTNHNYNHNQNLNNNNNNQDPLVPYTGSLADLDGFYRLDAVTILTGLGDAVITTTPSFVTLGAGSGPGVVRGNATLESSGSGSGAAQLGYVVTIDDSIYGNLGFQWEMAEWMIGWEAPEGRAILDDGDRVVVFRIGREGETVTLALDPDDARSLGEPPMKRLVMTRMAPPISEIAGQWIIESYVFGSSLTSAVRHSTCHPVDVQDGPPGTYGIADGTMTIEHTGWMHSENHFRTWQTPDCTGSVHSNHQFHHDFYYVIDEPGDRLEWWYEGLGQDDFHLYAQVRYTLDGTRLRLTVEENEANIDPSLYFIIKDATYIPAS